MKFLILLLLPSLTFADISLSDAYKREKSYLIAQKEALLKMKSSLHSSFIQRKSKAESDIESKQRELSALLIMNQELHEEYKGLEKSMKESAHMSGQLEKYGLKIVESLSEFNSKLGLTQVPVIEDDSVKMFETLLDQALQLIETISSDQWRSHAFLDENDHLVQGEVLFHGLYSAWGKIGEKIFTLIPYNNEFLKVSTSFSGNEAQFFDPSFERHGLKISKTWMEAFADALPGIVMLLIMSCVLGLFIMLAKA